VNEHFFRNDWESAIDFPDCRHIIRIKRPCERRAVRLLRESHVDDYGNHDGSAISPRPSFRAELVLERAMGCIWREISHLLHIHLRLLALSQHPNRIVRQTVSAGKRGYGQGRGCSGHAALVGINLALPWMRQAGQIGTTTYEQRSILLPCRWCLRQRIRARTRLDLFRRSRPAQVAPTRPLYQTRTRKQHFWTILLDFTTSFFMNFLIAAPPDASSR
jgi:hypothetical protein